MAGAPRNSGRGPLFGSRVCRRQPAVTPFDQKYTFFGAADFYGSLASIDALNGPECPKKKIAHFDLNSVGIGVRDSGPAVNGLCGMLCRFGPSKYFCKRISATY